MKRYLFIMMLLTPFLGFTQWSKTELRSQKVKESQAKLEYSALYSLNTDQLRQILKNAPERSTNSKGIIVPIPTAGGKVEKFQVWEFSNMAPELQAQHPEIRSYVGIGVDDPTAYLRFSLSHINFSSMISRSGTSEFIEPYTEDRKVYAVFDADARKDQADDAFVCSTIGEVEKNVANGNFSTNKLAGYNVFRLALSCTEAYGAYQLTAAGIPGSATDAQKKTAILAAMNASLTRMNGVFEKDLSIHFNLIANNTALIFYTGGTADPYTSGGPDDANTGISGIIPATDYDLGHLVDKQDANGAAYLGVICGSSQKAGGWTAHNFPEGDKFDIDYVAHEMGHQLGAGHTYTFYSGQLDQRVEPGSGSTIMAYTGIAGGNLDVQFNSNDYYHINSVNQIRTKVNSVTCGVNTPFTIAAPSIALSGGSYTIPKSTPFVIRATTSDAGSASYTYTVEQTDQAVAAQIGANSIAYATKPTGPLFRSVKPVSTPARYFPDFNKVLAGVLTTTWESVSSVARTLNFNMSVRNNNPTQPQIGQANMAVTVDAVSGPFQVTAPAFGQSLNSGTNFTVTWNVAGTTAAPVNTANVNIKLSTDGGLTFTTLAANTPNDGTQQVSIPAGSTSSNAYIMVEAVNNIYYAVSPSFVIDYTVTGESCTTYTYSGPAVTITDGPGGDAISSPRVLAPLTINNTGTITKIKVTPNIAHTYVQDLAVGIEAPNGTSALIWNRSCTSQDNIIASFSDTGAAATCVTPIQGDVKSYESLGIFKGHKAQGVWKLFASDNFVGDQGTINSWAIEVCTQATQALGVNEAPAVNNDIKIYPNPSNGNFFVKSRNLSGEVKVTLFDSSGRLIHTSSYQGGGDHTQEFNLSMPKGVYIINLNTSKGVHSQKMIIK